MYLVRHFSGLRLISNVVIGFVIWIHEVTAFVRSGWTIAEAGNEVDENDEENQAKQNGRRRILHDGGVEDCQLTFVAGEPSRNKSFRSVLNFAVFIHKGDLQVQKEKTETKGINETELGKKFHGIEIIF